MGIRADLDHVKERYIYYLIHKEIVLYVGTSVNPRSRYRTHLKKISDGNSAPIYQHCIKNNIKPILRIVSKMIGKYSDAEQIEIAHIQKHSKTIFNFYNNPDIKKNGSNKNEKRSN